VIFGLRRLDGAFQSGGTPPQSKPFWIAPSRRRFSKRRHAAATQTLLDCAVSTALFKAAARRRNPNPFGLRRLDGAFQSGGLPPQSKTLSHT